MGKKALVVKAADMANWFRIGAEQETERFVQLPRTEVALDESRSNSFFNQKTFLADRPACEVDTSILQYIPYVMLYRMGNNGQIEVFTYLRGKAGDEGRLHDKYSVGVGGHVEEEPTEDKDLFTVLYESTLREIEEEVGEAILSNDVRESVKASLRSPIVYLDTRTPTEAVHLGVFISVPVQIFDEDIKLEKGVIENSSWKPLKELIEMSRENQDYLERWSNVLVNNFTM